MGATGNPEPWVPIAVCVCVGGCSVRTRGFGAGGKRHMYHASGKTGSRVGDSTPESAEAVPRAADSRSEMAFFFLFFTKGELKKATWFMPSSALVAIDIN